MRYHVSVFVEKVVVLHQSADAKDPRFLVSFVRSLYGLKRLLLIGLIGDSMQVLQGLPATESFDSLVEKEVCSLHSSITAIPGINMGG
jgi:hypothetical protein